MPLDKNNKKLFAGYTALVSLGLGVAPKSAREWRRSLQEQLGADVLSNTKTPKAFNLVVVGLPQEAYGVDVSAETIEESMATSAAYIKTYAPTIDPDSGVVVVTYDFIKQSRLQGRVFTAADNWGGYRLYWPSVRHLYPARFGGTAPEAVLPALDVKAEQEDVKPDVKPEQIEPVPLPGPDVALPGPQVDEAENAAAPVVPVVDAAPEPDAQEPDHFEGQDEGREMTLAQLLAQEEDEDFRRRVEGNRLYRLALLEGDRLRSIVRTRYD